MAFIRQIRDAITGERRFSVGSNRRVRILVSSTCKPDRLSFSSRFARCRCFRMVGIIETKFFYGYRING